MTYVCTHSPICTAVIYTMSIILFSLVEHKLGDLFREGLTRENVKLSDDNT